MLPPKVTLYCSKCGKGYPLEYRGWSCSQCKSPLTISIDTSFLTKETFHNKGFNVWRYRDVIPVDYRYAISLGEGWTPIIEKTIFDTKVLFKLEYLNPTGSFKDRGSTVAVSKALSLNVKSIVEDSSGNTGLSVAAYGTAAGLRVRVYVPSDIPTAKKIMLELFGAKVILSGTRNDASKRVLKELTNEDYYIGHTWNPFFIEGTKTIAYETCEQLEWEPPDIIFIPVASGSLLLGFYKGFMELFSSGLIRSIPRLIGVQAEGYTPVYNVFHGKEPKNGVTRLADALRVSNPPRLKEIVKAIKETHGDVIIVSDNEIIDSLKTLAKMGFLVEPSSATVLAAFKKALSESIIDKGEKVLLPLTGTGLKMVSKLHDIIHRSGDI